MAKNPWGTPSKDSNPWAPPKPRGKQEPDEFHRNTYEKSSLFGKSEKHTGRAAGKASRDDAKKKGR